MRTLEEGSLSSFLVWLLMTAAWNEGGSTHQKELSSFSHVLEATGGDLQVELRISLLEVRVLGY